MKKTAGLLAVALLVAVTVTAQDQKVYVNDRNAQPRQVNGSYTGIIISGAIDLYASQSDQEVVVVSASEEKYRERIITEVKNGILHIYYNDKGLQFASGSKKLKAYVAFKKIESITASGSSDVYINGVIKGDVLKIDLSGSSDFKGAVDLNTLSLIQSGSSDSQISGRAEHVSINVSGASDVKGYDLMSQYCEATASGASDIQITVLKELNAAASGASDIYYKGDGLTRNIKSSGASSVTRKQ